MQGVKAVREAGADPNHASDGNEDGWASLDVWPKLGESEQSLFYHHVGRAVKRDQINCLWYSENFLVSKRIAVRVRVLILYSVDSSYFKQGVFVIPYAE